LEDTDMHTKQLSTHELLEMIVGESLTKELYQGRLMPLMVGERGTTPHPKLSASLELARRLVEEKLIRGPTLSTSKRTREYLTMHFVGQQHESFVTVFLDIQHKVIHMEELFQGTLHGGAVYPREVVKLALRYNAAACIFAHNHPSGNAEPSEADKKLTARLQSALSFVDIDVLDHVIVGAQEITSMAEWRML
jgi:DNA repair protein RadC